jgi:hypothetical protein
LINAAKNLRRLPQWLERWRWSGVAAKGSRYGREI